MDETANEDELDFRIQVPSVSFVASAEASFGAPASSGPGNGQQGTHEATSLENSAQFPSSWAYSGDETLDEYVEGVCAVVFKNVILHAAVAFRAFLMLPACICRNTLFPIDCHRRGESVCRRDRCVSSHLPSILSTQIIYVSL